MYSETLVRNYAIPSELYLDIARHKALNYGLNPYNLHFSDDDKHKLLYRSGNKNIYFGSSTNKDFIIYSLLEKMKIIPKGTAIQKRRLYISRASNILGDWEKNPLSKNNLAINILW